VKKIAMLAIVLVFVAGKMYGEEKSIFLPKSDNNIKTVLSYFKTPEEADNYVKTHTTAADYYKAGYYYFFYGVTFVDLLDEKKNADKTISFYQKAVDCLEKALDKEPNNPYYVNTYARFYLSLGGKKGFPEVMEYIPKGVLYLKKAVDLEPENPEIRMGQLIGFCYCYQQYPQFKPIIENDEKIIIAWIDDLNTIYKNNSKAKDMLEKKWGFGTKYSQVNEIYFALGYYYLQLQDRKKGYEYFSKLHKDSEWFKAAEKIQQDLNKVIDKK
jgi:tetratricopeptide (TPR) repeat protein